jgi:putative transcriptional regulator
MMPAMDGETLQAPVLLIAMPQVVDPFFHRSVVLLVHHDAEGAVGFIVNRPTGIAMDEILGGMELAWGGSGGEVAYFGGPVQPQLGSVLFTPAGRDGAAHGVTSVCAGLAMTQHIADLEALAAAPPPRFRLVLGYAGWGSGQLMGEILRNDWLTAPPDLDLVFADDPETVWEEALRTLGVDPTTLPSWSQAADAEEAN